MYYLGAIKMDIGGVFSFYVDVYIKKKNNNVNNYHRG